jgi:hypothetical protein
MLPRADPAQHRWNRSKKNRHIKSKAPILDVMSVQPCPLIKVQIASPRDLPQSGQSRRSRKVIGEEMPVKTSLGIYDGPRTNQRHVAAQYIEKLWDFIQAPATEKAPDASHPRIMPLLVDPQLQHDAVCVLACKSVRRGVRPHGTEFPYAKWDTPPADPLFGIKDRVGRSQANSQRNQNSGNQEHDPNNQRAHDIECPLDITIAPGIQRQFVSGLVVGRVRTENIFSFVDSYRNFVVDNLTLQSSHQPLSEEQ